MGPVDSGLGVAVFRGGFTGGNGENGENREEFLFSRGGGFVTGYTVTGNVYAGFLTVWSGYTAVTGVTERLQGLQGDEGGFLYFSGEGGL